MRSTLRRLSSCVPPSAAQLARIPHPCLCAAAARFVVRVDPLAAVRPRPLFAVCPFGR